jgi:hypothetical protein
MRPPSHLSGVNEASRNDTFVSDVSSRGLALTKIEIRRLKQELAGVNQKLTALRDASLRFIQGYPLRRKR